MDIFEKFLKDHNFAKKFGFYWENHMEIIDQISFELDEVKHEIEKSDRVALQKELGDVLHACFELVAFLEMDIKETLDKAVAKIGKRYEVMQEVAEADGVLDFANISREMKLDYWGKAKRQLKDVE